MSTRVRDVETRLSLPSTAEVYFAQNLAGFDHNLTPSLTLVKHDAPIIIGLSDPDVFIRRLNKRENQSV